MIEKYIAKTSAIASPMRCGEMMVMSTAESTFFTLNPVVSAVWQAADGLTPLSEIVNRDVCSKFGADPAAAFRDVEQLVAELSKHGILLVSSRTFGSSSPGRTEGT